MTVGGGEVVRAEAGGIVAPASSGRPGHAPVPHAHATPRSGGGETGEVGRRGGRRRRGRRVGCRGRRGRGRRAVPGPAGGGGLAVEHAEFVVDAVGGGGGGGRAEVVRVRGLLLGGGDVAQHAVYRRHLK